jgi:Spy/CpxP family protein refolding chaperone
MVREHAEELQLTDGQVDRLRKATSDVRNEVDQLEWDVSRESRKLAKLLREGATKEQVYAQMDVVFTYENKIKKKMLGMLIVVRDVLTKQQREQLDALKADWRENHPGRGMGMGRGGRGHQRQGPGFPPEPPEGPPPGPPPSVE